MYLSNPIGVLPDREFIKLQALKKIGGQWQAPEDWTAERYKQFCLDQQDERIEELLLIVSNSEANRATEMPFMIPATFPMQLSTSNVGCWAWVGEASTTTTSGPPDNLDARATATQLVFRVRATLPGRINFGPVIGTVSGQQTNSVSACQYKLVSETKDLYRGLGSENGPPGDDGTIDVNLDLDLGFGAIAGAEPPDRQLITLSGSSVSVRRRHLDGVATRTQDACRRAAGPPTATE